MQNQSPQKSKRNRTASARDVVEQTKPTDRDQQGSSTGPFRGGEHVRWEEDKTGRNGGVAAENGIRIQKGLGQYDNLAKRVKTFLMSLRAEPAAGRRAS